MNMVCRFYLMLFCSSCLLIRVEKSACLMRVSPGDQVDTPVWSSYQAIIQQRAKVKETFEYLGRFDFYERAKKTYAIVATGEGSLYANIILEKGVITD